MIVSAIRLKKRILFMKNDIAASYLFILRELLRECGLSRGEVGSVGRVRR